MGLHENHRERLRKRYETSGLDDFEDHVILELLLFHSIPRVDTNPTAHRLISQFGSLAGVLAASKEELCRVKGVGPAAAQMLNNVSGQMLFRMLEGCDLSGVNERFALAAEWHMRTLSEAGAVSVFAPGIVMDYVSEDGDAEGLGALIVRDMAEAGASEYAVVIRCGGITDAVLDGLKTELARYHFPLVYRLTGYTLEKIQI